MKRNIIYLLILVALVAASYYLLSNKKNKTLSDEVSEFGIKDTGSIQKVFMADKKGNEITLTREEQYAWKVNGSYEARPDPIVNLLTTINMVSVRSPVAKAGYNNVMKQLASGGIKVEIYGTTGLIKTYYVGGPTQDQMGTFMYLEGASVPFVTQIPGFDGYLTPRYIVTERDWKTKKIFHLKPAQISRVMAKDYTRKQYNIIVEGSPEQVFSVFSGEDDSEILTSQDKIISYLNYFSFINYEFEEESLTDVQIDSVKSSPPLRELLVVENGGTATKLTFWRRPVTDETTHKSNADGEAFPFDVDRMLAKIDGSDQLLVVQYYSFDRLFKKPSDFVNPKN